MRKAQQEANKTKKYVAVFLRNQVSYIEPNLPPLSNSELDARLKRLLQEEKDEENSDSILSRPKPSFKSKLSKKQQNTGNIFYSAKVDAQ